MYMCAYAHTCANRICMGVAGWGGGGNNKQLLVPGYITTVTSRAP